MFPFKSFFEPRLAPRLDLVDPLVGGWGCDAGAKRMTPYREYGVAVPCRAVRDVSCVTCRA